MQISDDFKQAIADEFQDKLIEVFDQTTMTDDEGEVTVSIDLETPSHSFNAHVWFDNLARIMEEAGLTEKINIAMTTIPTSDCSAGAIFRYDDQLYRCVKVFPYDSHKMIVGEKWQLKS